MTGEQFIEKAIKIHGNKYDYSEVEYVDSLTKVKIICPEHGEFWQVPSGHLRGRGCPICANMKRGKKRTEWEDVVRKFRDVHGDKYDYSKAVYKNANSKIMIICPEHGEFMQSPICHMNGQGCPKCAGRGLDNSEIINKFKATHGDEYDYSKVKYIDGDTKVEIICKEHGSFWQRPIKHISGQGCPKCAKMEQGKFKRTSFEDFVKKANAVHNWKYDYSECELKSQHDKIKIICPTHGEFYQYPYDHLNGHGCPSCGCVTCVGENEIYEYICNLIGKDKVILKDREVLNGKEIDIFIPEYKVGIEYNGLSWHSELFGKTKNYHVNKTNECEAKGIKLIQIFEDEYTQRKDIVLEKLRHILGKCEDKPKIMARKCEIKEISHDLAREFLNKNHIQGGCLNTVSLGAYYHGKLTGVMCFRQTGKDKEWELNRFASDNNVVCQGVGGKLFSYFVKKYDPEVIKSFADRRWTLDKDNNIYVKMNFKLVEILKPEYRYINPNKATERIHKFNLRKKELHRKYDFSMDMTEKQMVEKLGLARIWDCGLYKYVWTKKAED